MTSHMIVRRATQEDVFYVFGNLWERGKLELEILGHTVDSAVGLVCNLLEPGPAVSFEVDGEPVLVTGLVPISGCRGASTWFQATEAFPFYAKVITSELRKQLEGHAAANALEFVEIVSPCVHPRTGRWFGALGFTLDVDRYIPSRAGGRLYRFERRFDKGAGNVPQS